MSARRLRLLLRRKPKPTRKPLLVRNPKLREQQNASRKIRPEKLPTKARRRVPKMKQIRESGSAEQNRMPTSSTPKTFLVALVLVAAARQQLLQTLW